MANQVFDTTIVRPLERPSAADLNQMQGQMYRTFRAIERLRYGYDLTSVFMGFMNYSFFVQANGLMQLRINRGVGYLDNYTSNTNIDGIPGLNDINSYKPVFLSDDKLFTVPAVPTSGKCRRDLLEVRWYRDTVDPLNLEIYDPGTKNFSTTSLDKTMTTDLAGKGVDFFENGVTPPTTAYFIYKKGPEVDYVDESSFLNSTLPSVDAECLALASINVKHGDFVIPNTRIADLRKLLGNDRQFTISGSATVGRNSDGSQYLSDVSITAPTGVRCSISKINQYFVDEGLTTYANNEYQLSYFGPRVSVFEPTFTMHGPITNGATELYPFVANVTNSGKNISSTLNANLSTAEMIRDTVYSMPDVSLAVGQPFAFIRFALNIVQDRAIPPSGATQIVNRTNFSTFSANDLTDRTRQISFVIVGQYAV